MVGWRKSSLPRRYDTLLLTTTGLIPSDQARFFSYNGSTLKSLHGDVQFFDLFPGPGCLAQELQARLHRGIGGEALDPDPVPQFLPAVIVDQAGHDSLESDSVQRVVGLFSIRNAFILHYYDDIV